MAEGKRHLRNLEDFVMFFMHEIQHLRNLQDFVNVFNKKEHEITIQRTRIPDTSRESGR
jgi:hypothetical protein